LEDGRLLRNADQATSMQSWSLETAEPLKHIAFGSGGLIIAAMFQDAAVKAFRCPVDRAGGCATTPIAAIFATAVAVSPDGQLAAIGDADGTLHLARTDGRSSATTLIGNGKSGIRALAWSPDGNRLAVGIADGDLAILDKEGSTIATARDGTGGVASIAWDKPSGRIAATCGDRMICVWTLDEGGQEGASLRRVARLAAGADAVSALAWSPDGKFLASSSGDTVQLWTIDRRDGAVFTLDIGEDLGLSQLSVSPDASWLASGDDKGRIHLWQMPTFSEPLLRQQDGMEDLRAMAWSGDGTLGIVDAGGHLIAIRPPARRPTVDLSLGADDVQALQWMPDGDAVITGGKLDGALQLTSLTGQTLKPFDRLHREAVTALAVSGDGKRLLSADASGSAQLWDIATRAAGSAAATGAGRGTAAFSRDNKLLLLAGNDGDALVYRVDDMAAAPRRCRSGSTMLDDAAFAEDGTAIYAMGGDRAARLYIWSLGQSCELLATAPVPTESASAGKGRRHVVVLPRPRRLAVAASGSRIWLIAPDPAMWASAARDLAAWEQDVSSVKQ
jgi:WD40 repeat protein